MPVFWYDGLSLGHEDIDRQHQGLFDLVNELEEAIMQQRSLTILADVVERLNVYAAEHFAAEERLMREHRYPGFAAHQQAHELFIEKVMSFNFMPDAYEHPSKELYQFLRTWLIEHIRIVDKAVVAHLGQSDVQPASGQGQGFGLKL